MKTKEELSALKNEVEALNQKLAELTDEELNEVSGGIFLRNRPSAGKEGENYGPVGNIP